MSGYVAWWSEKPDDHDLTLLQVKAWASMATVPSYVELRPMPARGKWTGPGWGAFIVRGEIEKDEELLTEGFAL